MDIVTVFIMFTVFLLTRVTNLKRAVYIMALQAVTIALACIVIGAETGEHHFYIAAFLTVIMKVCCIPVALFYITKQLKHEKEDRPYLSLNMSSLAAALAIIISYSYVGALFTDIVSRDALAAAIALILIGLLLIVTRRLAIMQIVGLNTMENGIYLLGLSVTKGLPLIIEFGITLDVLVAVMILVFLTFRLKNSFACTDTTVLRRLKG